LKQLQICLIEKEYLSSIKSQKELNELYELPSMNVSAKYSYISKTVLMAFLYIPIFPLGIPISLFGFLFGYWLEKYNFAHRYKRPEMLNRQLCEFYANYFVVCLAVFGIGDYVFLHDIYDSNMWSLINMILFIVIIFIPYNKLLSIKYINIKDSDFFKQTFEEAYNNCDFHIDYERANPMTKDEGEERYDNVRRAKGLISNEEYEQNKLNRKNRDNMGFYFNNNKLIGNYFRNNLFQQDLIPPFNNDGQDPYIYNRNPPDINSGNPMYNQYPQPEINHNIAFNPVNSNYNPQQGYSSSNRFNEGYGSYGNNNGYYNQGYPNN
jgi:hypothetical protein